MCLLNSDLGFRILKPIIVEGTRSRFGLTQCKELVVPVPPMSLQEKFARIVRQCEHFRAPQRESERQMQHLFQTLLHRAFRGELITGDMKSEVKFWSSGGSRVWQRSYMLTGCVRTAALLRTPLKQFIGLGNTDQYQT